MARRFSNIFELAEEFLYDPGCGTSLRLLGRLAILTGNAAALTRARGAFEDLWDRRAEEYVYSDGFDSEYQRRRIRLRIARLSCCGVSTGTTSAKTDVGVPDDPLRPGDDRRRPLSSAGASESA